jgi:RNA polymerase sigma factor (sigma-70 family)
MISPSNHTRGYRRPKRWGGHTKRLTKYLERRSESVEDAEDAAQETISKLLKRLKEGKKHLAIKNIRAYLRKTGERVLVDEYRRKYGRPRSARSVKNSTPIIAANDETCHTGGETRRTFVGLSEVAELAVDDTSPERQDVDLAEFAEFVCARADDLTENIFRLSAEGNSRKEIAAKLGMTPRALRCRILKILDAASEYRTRGS